MSITRIINEGNKDFQTKLQVLFSQRDFKIMHALCYIYDSLYDGVESIVGPIELDKEGKSISNSILEEIIQITERPFGIRFDIDTGSVIVQDVLINSLASQFGLTSGDRLIKINEVSLSTLTPLAALELFDQTQLPFNATFEKSVLGFIQDISKSISVSKQEQDISSIDDHENDNNDNINNNVFGDKTFKFEDLDILGLSLSNLQINDEELSNDNNNFTPYSPKFSDSDISEMENNGVESVDKNKNEFSCSDVDCSFSFGSLEFENDQSLHSSSLETPMPSSPMIDINNKYTHSKKYSNITDKNQSSIKLLKELLTYSDEAKRNQKTTPDPIDVLLDECKMEKYHSNSSINSINSNNSPNQYTHNIKKKKRSSKRGRNSHKTKKFLRKYLWMDQKRIFDEYLVHNINDDNVVIGDATPTTKCRLRLKLDQMSRSATFNDRSDKTLRIEGYDEDKVIAIMSTNGLNKGYHEWSFKILQCDIYRQEIGIIGCGGIKDKRIDINGIKDTSSFGARAIYGNELLTDSLYYASYNMDGKERCYRDLSKNSKIGWCTGDIIKVCLDLDKWKVKFYLNDQKVRKTMSIQRNNIYYPIISFAGHCRYELLEFQSK